MNSSSSRARKSTPSRKKACQNCATAKVRCSLEKPTCSRCRAHAKQCRYAPRDENMGVTGGLNFSDSPSVSGQSHDFVDIAYSSDPSIGTTHANPHSVTIDAVGVNPDLIKSLQIPPNSKECLNFDNVSLLPMADAEEIRNYWMRSLLSPTPDQVPKVFHPFTLECISCILRSYPGHVLSPQGVPPIIHPMQIADHSVPASLANCFSLVRLWQKRTPGSEEMVASVLKKEMQRLIDIQPTESDFDLLCSFQAYLMYTIMAYFFPISNILCCDDFSMITLQEIAFRTAKAGVMCKDEVSRSRPSWESWIVASAKRRCLFVMYIFSNLYHARQGVPNFVAKELKGIYVSEGRSLWDARDRCAWRKEYSRHLSQWDDGMLEISELWRSPETGSERTRSRISRWLQTTDEFGMMLFMTAGHVHGC